MLFYCGLPETDIDFVVMDGPPFGDIVAKECFRCTQFTGSSYVAELLAGVTRGKIKIEDSGFDWKVLGRDVRDIDYVAWTCD